MAVRVKPGAGRTQVGGTHPGPLGKALVIEVKAPAVDGAATEAARRALAKALGVPISWVSLRSGQRSRDKLFRLSPAPRDLAERVRALSSPRQGW